MFKTLSTITLLGLLAFPAAQAQSNQALEAHVPFTFQVQNRTFTPGTYRLSYSSLAPILSLRGGEQISRTAYVRALPAKGSNRAGREAKLVFECYGKSCYLTQMWQSADSGGAGLQLPRGDRESHISLSTRAVRVIVPAK